MSEGDGARIWWKRLAAGSPVLISLLVHLVAGFSLGGIPVPGREAPVSPPPPPVRFELVDTPESAAVDEPPESPELYSDRNSRSQQPVDSPDAGPVTGRPRILDDGEGHDLRPAASAPQRAPTPRLAPPSAPAVESPASRASEQAPSRAEPEPEGLLPAKQEQSAVAAQPSSAAPPTPLGEAPMAGPSQEGRRSFSPAEQDELARASATGEFSYEATQHFFATYLFRLRDRIDSQWTLHLMTRFLVPGDYSATVDFLVMPDGTIDGLRMRKLEGGADFGSICTRSIRKAGPFGPVPYDLVPGLPPQLRGTPLRIRFTFQYR